MRSGTKETQRSPLPGSAAMRIDRFIAGHRVGWLTLQDQLDLRSEIDASEASSWMPSRSRVRTLMSKRQPDPPPRIQAVGAAARKVTAGTRAVLINSAGVRLGRSCAADQGGTTLAIAAYPVTALPLRH